MGRWRRPGAIYARRGGRRRAYARSRRHQLVLVKVGLRVVPRRVVRGPDCIDGGGDGSAVVDDGLNGREKFQVGPCACRKGGRRGERTRRVFGLHTMAQSHYVLAQPLAHKVALVSARVRNKYPPSTHLSSQPSQASTLSSRYHIAQRRFGSLLPPRNRKLREKNIDTENSGGTLNYREAASHQGKAGGTFP